MPDHPVHPDLNRGPPRLPVFHPGGDRSQLAAQVDAEVVLHVGPSSEEPKRGHLPHLCPHGVCCDNGCGGFRFLRGSNWLKQ